MNLSDFLEKLKNTPKELTFADTMAVIDAQYLFTPTEFENGNQHNPAGENSGSCKLFAFAKELQLTQNQTLACFGAYYFEDVLENPEDTNHQNIRNFMISGWDGIAFQDKPLALK